MRELTSAGFRHLKNFGGLAVAACLSLPGSIDDSIAARRMRGAPPPGRIVTVGASLGASLLTLIAISFASLGLWRIGADLDQAGDFVLQSGFLSHWQVWIGAAVGTQFAGVQLSRYANTLQGQLDDGAIEEISVALTDESEAV